MERLLTMLRGAPRLVFAALLALLIAACGSSPGPDPLMGLAPPPAVLPSPEGGAADALLGGGEGFSTLDPDLNWGVGVLRPSGDDGYGRISLPLFEYPNGPHWGWIVRGQVYDRLEARTLPDRTGATAPLPGGRAWIALQQDGRWVRIRYGEPGDRGAGVAWTRAELAQNGRASVATWESLLQGARGVVFRSTSTHNLRADPDTEARVVRRVSGDGYDMDVEEIRGDWMRVEVHVPPACSGSAAQDQLLGGSESQTFEGWVFWRSAERGPWVRPAPGPRCAPGA